MIDPVVKNHVLYLRYFRHDWAPPRTKIHALRGISDASQRVTLSNSRLRVIPHLSTATMGGFDQSKAYAAQEQDGAFFDDGREIELLHFVYSHPNINEIRGSPKKVLDAIDEYGRTKKYLMNVGEDKGKIVTDLIAEVKPKTMV